MASVLLPSDGDSAFERESSTKDTSEHPCKRSKHSALNNVSQLFQQVCMTSRAMWQNIASDCGPVCVAQVVQKLEASRQRSSNWTVFEEFALLCEAWSRVARREPSAAFAFNGHSANAQDTHSPGLRMTVSTGGLGCPSQSCSPPRDCSPSPKPVPQLSLNCSPSPKPVPQPSLRLQSQSRPYPIDVSPSPGQSRTTVKCVVRLAQPL